MAWTYHAEYRLGPMGGRVTRTYGGFRAFLAIGVDLTLGLVFGAFGLVFRAIGWVAWLAVNLLRLTFLAIRDLIRGLARFVTAVIALPWRSSRPAPGRHPAKPAWVAFDDL